MVGAAPRGPLLSDALSQVLEAEVRATGTGLRLPSEAHLRHRFGVSRETLRAALTKLAERGLVHPQAGRGWFTGARPGPAPQPVSEAPGALESFTDMAARLGLRAGAKVLGLTYRTGTWEEARRLRIAPGAGVLSLRRLRTLDGVPVAVDRSVVPAAMLPQVTPRDVEDRSLHALFRSSGRSPSSAEYEVQAAGCPAEDAPSLGLHLGEPVLTTEQVCLDEHDVPIEWGRMTYRGDRYRFRTVLRA